MKRILSMLLALSLSASVMSVSAYDAEVELYDFDQPMNRVMLERNDLEQKIEEQPDAYFNDPYYSEQWYISATNSSLAWESLTENNSVIVAVVDTGVDYTHEDLENRVLYELGYDFANDDDDPMDDNGHGTHVSGIIAAEANNGIGITGITGDLDVSILPIKALNSDGTGETEDIAAGILYAVEMGADIINLSLGSNAISSDIRAAIQTALDANVFVVVASGNDSSLCTPTSLANMQGVFTVSAVNEQDVLAYFSNYGDCVDAYAPGVSILSTYLDNEYAYQDGTSMAAPIVSAAAAILLSQNPDLDIEELSSLLSFSNTTTTQNNQQTTVQQNITQQTIIQPNSQINTKNVINNVFSNYAINNNQMIIPNTTINKTTTVNQTSSTQCGSINIYNAILSLYNK